MKKKIFRLLVLLSLIHAGLLREARSQSGGQTNVSVDPSNPGISYQGRTGSQEKNFRILYWPGSSVKMRFRGSSVSALLKDQRGSNFYNIILDDDSIQVIKLDSVLKKYELVTGLSNGVHTIEIFRRNGYTSGKTWFYGFELPASGSVLPLSFPRWTIEFYGNSITVGSAMYPDGYAFGQENNYNSYAAITARHFKAGYSCIARSGLGLMVSWFHMIMPDLYYRENPFDSASKWNFSSNQPDIVVINLFQNDCALLEIPTHPEFLCRFGSQAPGEKFIINAYRNFLLTIRKCYPHSFIVCTLGSMDAVKMGSPWPSFIKKAAGSLQDKKILTHFFKYKNTPDHPNENEHRAMAESLIGFINEHIKW